MSSFCFDLKRFVLLVKENCILWETRQRTGRPLHIWTCFYIFVLFPNAFTAGAFNSSLFWGLCIISLDLQQAKCEVVNNPTIQRYLYQPGKLLCCLAIGVGLLLCGWMILVLLLSAAAVPVPSEAITEQPACLADGKACSGMSDVHFISTLSTFRCFISACLENFSS